MKARFVVSSQSPLNLRVSRSTSSFETLKYIPGTALLGAFAAAHRKTSDNPDEFTRFFLSDKISFGNLYPANFQVSALRGDNRPIKPIPHSARSCKRFNGFLFKAEESGQERHGVLDSLICWGLFALSGQAKIGIFDAYKECNYTDKDGKCKEMIDAFSGFYRRGNNIAEIGKSEVTTRMLTRTGISRETGTVQEGILYNREVLNEGQSFWGIMSFTDQTLHDDFDKFADCVGDKGILRIGNNLTRSLGKLRVPKIQELSTDDMVSFKKRVEEFNEKFCAEAEKYCVPLPHKFYFPITLQSDAILLDQQLRYQTTLNGDYLHCTWNLSDVTLIYQNASQRRVTGWNALFGLPKATELAISMGSVFLFGCHKTVNEHFYQNLYNMEQVGIGKRTSEGFGHITVADAFHREINKL